MPTPQATAAQVRPTQGERVSASDAAADGRLTGDGTRAAAATTGPLASDQTSPAGGTGTPAPAGATDQTAHIGEADQHHPVGGADHQRHPVGGADHRRAAAEAAASPGGTVTAEARGRPTPPSALGSHLGGRHLAARRRRRPVWPVVFLGYLALAFLLLNDAWRDPGSRGFGTSDATLFSWYLGWVPHAIGNGMNPFVTDLINTPYGVNILWSTPVVLLAVLVAPVTLLAGPVVALNTLLTLALAVSGIAMYAAARRFASPAPAAVAGLLYAFSPYMVGATHGHLHLTFAPFPPLLLILLHDVVVRGRSPRRVGLLLGVAVAAQALISEEILATSALVGALALVILAVRHASAVRARVGPLAQALGICAAVAGALLAWPLHQQFLGPQRVYGAIQPHDVAVSDLLTFVVPTGAQRLAPDVALRHSDGFTGNAVEVSAYFGIPLLVLLAVIAFRLRRDPLVGLLSPLFVVVALLSLGGHLHVDGRVTDVWLPWAVAQDLPLLGSALPSRFSLYLTMFAGLLLARWPETARWPARQAWPRRAGTVLVLAAALVPLLPAPMRAEPLTTPAFFTGPAVEAIPEGSRVLIAPYPRAENPSAMLWQAQAGHRFAIPGCYCTVPAGPDGEAEFHGPSSPLTDALLMTEAGLLTPEAALALPGLRAAYQELAPDAVIVGPTRHRAELIEVVTGLTGRPPVEIGGVAFWPLTF